MSKLPSVVQTLMDQQERFAKQNRWGLVFEQECLFAKQLVMRSSKTVAAAQNNAESLKSAILNVAAIGISLNPASAHAYLVPRDEAICLDISYRGLVKLATDAGAIEWAKAVLVYEGDEFTWNGPAEPPTHKADVFNPLRMDATNPLKNLKGGYCLAKLANGGFMVDTMTAGEIAKVAATSKARNGPWQQWPEEMAKKTLVKRASKSWPQSGGRDRVDRAIEILNEHEGITIEQPADEAVISEFMDKVAAGDAMALHQHMGSLTEQQQNDCYNAAPRGEKVALKNRVSGLMRQANQVLDEYTRQIGEYIESRDSDGIQQLLEELTEYERKMVDARLTDIEHRQIAQIAQEAAT